MARHDDSGPLLPPRIKAAFQFLHLARLITEQIDASNPMRGLSPLEKSVETAALRALQQYLLGEMDFADDAQPAAAPARDDDGEVDSG